MESSREAAKSCVCADTSGADGSENAANNANIYFHQCTSMYDIEDINTTYVDSMKWTTLAEDRAGAALARRAPSTF